MKDNKTALIIRNNEMVISAHLKDNNIFELNIKTVIQESCNIVHPDVKIWHERLEHINIRELLNMNKAGAFPATLSGKDKFICEACQYGKQARLPFRKSERGTYQAGDIVYSDVCGPTEEPSISGKRYFVLFKDGATSYRHVYFLKHKSEVLEYFMKYNSIVNNQFHHDIHILHTDDG